MDPDAVGPMITISVIAIVTGVTLIFRGPLGRALARRIEGPSAVDPGIVDRVLDLEERAHHQDQLQERVLELEQRLDFTERLLARQEGARRVIGAEGGE